MSFQEADTDGVNRSRDVTDRKSAVVGPAPIGGELGTRIEPLEIQMTRQLGNSGRGTDGPAPPMSEHERRKSADASGSGNDAHQQRGPAGSEARRRGVELEEEEERPLGSEARQGGNERGEDEPRRPAEPGGGRSSESEKPDSPDSRWGGGR